MVLHSNRYESMFIISLKNCARYSKLILNDKFLKMSDFPIINPQKHLFSFMWIYQRNNRLGINIKKIWEFFSCIDFIWASLKDLILCVFSLDPHGLQKRLLGTYLKIKHILLVLFGILRSTIFFSRTSL